MRLENLAIAFFAVLALVAGSTVMEGLPYWLFTLAIIVAAVALSFASYVARSRRWITESYRLLGEGQLARVRQRVDDELGRASSAISKPVLELLEGEVLFWSGEVEAARERAGRIDIEALPEVWRGALHGLRVAAAAFTGRHDEARLGIEAHREALSERPGFHYLEAVVALREGDAVKARERLESVAEPPPRMRIVRAARAMLRAEIARAHGENADAFVAEAIEYAGESFVAARARALA